MTLLSDQLERLAAQVARLEAERDELARQAEEQPAEAPTPTPYLTVDQAAELASCNPQTVRRAVNAGRLRAFRLGARVRLLEADVRGWVESHTAAPAALPRPGRPSSRRVQPGSVAAIREIERQMT